MILLNESGSRSAGESRGAGTFQSRGQGTSQLQEGQSQARQVNVGSAERQVSIAAGSILALLGLSRRSVPGILIAGIGGAMIYRGATGHCGLYERLGLDTAADEEVGREDTEDLARRGLHIEQALLINRPAADVYAFWRDFSKLPQFMTHLDRVDVRENGESHWVARLSRMAGGNLEWDARITADEPNARIAWESLPGSEVQTTGEVRFSDAMGDRGTEMHVLMNFRPPGFALARMFPSFFTKATRRLMRNDLRRFKQLMELGEIVTIDGQPHGTCTGRGTYYHDS